MALAVLNWFSRLRALARGTVASAPEVTAHHVFTKTGPAGERMLLVLDADDHRAVETVTVGGRVTETTTPIGSMGLAVWYAHRYAQLLADGWQPTLVVPPLQVPSAP